MPYHNCLDYLDQWGDQSFLEAPFCEIDSLILSVCAYAPFEGVLPGLDASETMPLVDATAILSTQPGWDRTGPLMAHRIPRLVEKAAQCPRFAQLPLGCFESILHEGPDVQFAAVTYFLPDGTLYLAFRGTDDTLTGWEESFRMTFSAPIPGQKLAEEYLTQVAQKHPGRLRLGGHSKGGNLALWAAIHASADFRRRILRASSFDGPGFTQDLTNTAAYRALAPRLFTFVPQASLVGALLHQDKHCQLIRSHGKGVAGQHDPFTWEVCGTRLLPVERRSPLSQRSADTLHTWMAQMTTQELEEFVELLFDLLAAGKAKTLTDILDSLGDSARAIGQAYHALPLETRKEIHGYLRRLMVSFGQVNRPKPARPPGSKGIFRRR